jgi:hypothetical protein
MSSGLAYSTGVFSSIAFGHIIYHKFAIPKFGRKVSKKIISTAKNKDESAGKMKRNESEFSVGLTNSSSISNELNELGPLCFSGYFHAFNGENIYTMNNLLVIGITSAILASIGQSIYEIYQLNQKGK